MNSFKVLVVEDEAELAEVIAYNLHQQGYTAIIASDAESAFRLASACHPDMILLDVMLPGGSGLEICRRLRKEGNAVPILMLTACTAESDKVNGLESGADDYLTKPFSMRELMARVKSLFRRCEVVSKKTYMTLPQMGLTIDTERREVMRNDTVIPLSRKEFDLFIFLAQRPGKVFAREDLLKEVWSTKMSGNMRTVDVHMRWLREKLEQDASDPQFLQTVYGIGYKLKT
jgi:two-component system, OmpR family, response regulator